MFQLRTKMWNFLPGYERKTNNKYSEDSLEKKRRKKRRRNKRRLKALAFLKKRASVNFYYLHISVTQQHHTDKAHRKCSS